MEAFQLKLIKTEADYEAACVRIYDLMQESEPLDPAQEDELDILSLLVEDYEKHHYPVPPPHPLEAIRFRIEQLGLSEAELGRILGIRQRKSDILSSRRKLSLGMIRRLHKALNISAEVLIQD
jgi:HTH-type transcriptional regulator / antitoxin HigA